MRRATPCFRARHYRALADAIAAVKALPHDAPAEVVTDIEQELADRFAADNPKFRRSLFHDACNRAPKAREGRPS